MEAGGRGVNPPVFTALNAALCNLFYLFHLFWQLELRALTKHLVPPLIQREPAGGRETNSDPSPRASPCWETQPGSVGLTPARYESAFGGRGKGSARVENRLRSACVEKDEAQERAQFLPPGSRRADGDVCVRP